MSGGKLTSPKSQKMWKERKFDVVDVTKGTIAYKATPAEIASARALIELRFKATVAHELLLMLGIEQSEITKQRRGITETVCSCGWEPPAHRDTTLSLRGHKLKMNHA